MVGLSYTRSVDFWSEPGAWLRIHLYGNEAGALALGGLLALALVLLYSHFRDTERARAAARDGPDADYREQAGPGTADRATAEPGAAADRAGGSGLRG